MKFLTVVLGAGASNSQNILGKVSDNLEYRPPLTKEVFSNTNAFSSILHKYPRAEVLASDISHQIRQNRPGNGLEQILKKYEQRISVGEDSHYTRQFLEIPLYLNDLFGEVSQHFTRQPDEYNILVNHVLDMTDKVLFLSLNYDTLLEMSLSTNAQNVDFSNLDQYLTHEKWILAKIHGSTNWYKSFNSYMTGTTTSKEDYLKNLYRQPIKLPLVSEYIMFPYPGHQKLFDGNVPLYPAITVPVDGKYEYNCPPKMIDCAIDFIKECVNFLIIGTSGNDKDLLDLLKLAKGGNTLFVGRNEQNIKNATTKILFGAPRMGTGYDSFCQPLGLTSFVESGALDKFLSNLR